MRKEEKFREIYKEAKKDLNVIGLFFGGSRGKDEEFVKPDSDYDLYIIVKDSVKKKYEKKYYGLEDKDFEFVIKSLSEFKKEKSEEWQRYALAHVKALIDKDKQIQKIIIRKSKLPKEVINQHINGNLDGYINYVFRSLKCWRDNNPLAARLEANRTIECLLRVLFSFHNGRTVPYYKHLQWELRKYPLNKFPMGSKDLLDILTKIMDNADIKSQQKLLKTTEMTFRKAGYGKIFDSWGWKLNWMKSFKKKV